MVVFWKIQLWYDSHNILMVAFNNTFSIDLKLFILLKSG